VAPSRVSGALDACGITVQGIVKQHFTNRDAFRCRVHRFKFEASCFMKPLNVHVKFLHSLWDEDDLRSATSGSCGLDLKACLHEASVCLAPGQRAAIPSGLAIDIRQPGIAGFVFSRSGVGTKQGLVVSQGVGVIDPDYRGEIIVSLLNTSFQERVISRGQRIAQLLFLPFYPAVFTVVDALSATERGAGGFGHTGL